MTGSTTGDPGPVWPPTTRMWVAGAVGAAIALTGAAEGAPATAALRFPGYVVACMAIVVWTRIVARGHLGWFVAHESAMAAIVVGWVLADNGSGAAINGVWLVAAAAWWLVGIRRRG